MTKPTTNQIIVFVVILLATNGATALVAHQTSNNQSGDQDSAVTKSSAIVPLSFGDNVQKTVNNFAPHLNEKVSLTGKIAQLPSGTRDYIISQPTGQNFSVRLDFSKSALKGDGFINKKQSQTVTGILKFDSAKNNYYIEVSSIK